MGDVMEFYALAGNLDSFPQSLCGQSKAANLIDLSVAPQDVLGITPEHMCMVSPSIVKERSENSTGIAVATDKEVWTTALITTANESSPEDATPRQKGRENKRPPQSACFICEYPGCTIKFGRKKDRNRHFRIKHQASQGYRCPLVDCSIGTGHRIQRRDKLREHLRRKSESSSPWQCILPGCTTTTSDRSALIDHLGCHDRITRLQYQQLLIDYSFISGDLHQGSYYDKPPLGYLTCSYICVIQGCSFGTNSLDAMNTHVATPHVGPHCPCPIPSCHQSFQEWHAASAHLARTHDATERKTFDRELLDQGFWWRNSVFTCPICKVEIKVLLNKVSCDDKIRDHCSTHDEGMLNLFEGELVKAFASSNRRTLWYPRMPLLDPASDEQVFAYLTWPKEKLLQIWGMGGMT